MQKRYIVMGSNFQSVVITEQNFVMSCDKPITGFIYQSLDDLKKWCDKKHFLIVEDIEKKNG